MNFFKGFFACSLFFSSMTHCVMQERIISKEVLIEELYDIGSIQFGDFVLKVSDGYLNTPIYIDMRQIMSHPHLMRRVINLIHDSTKDLVYDLVCGVPYAALPYAVGISLEINKPMIMSRQIVKHYGTCRAIEGNYKDGDVVLLIEDVIVSGASVLSATGVLRNGGLIVNDVIVLCDREQGALEKMVNRGLRPHVVFTITDVLDVLCKKNKIEEETADIIRDYIRSHQCH